ncbi:MAG TPA: c-type cytochrome, partial [Usitatibacter sp.]|nr:c-type cytochrome [Usitatibacter sp.]
LWDYINRAMPWNAPKSLTTEEVYAVVAYLLHLGDILPADFVLSDRNIAEVQERLPNRNGMQRNHGLWDIKGKPDVANVACMKDCPTSGETRSELPDYAKGSHGNLAEQLRQPNSGPDRGLTPVSPISEVAELAKSKGCLSCHAADKRIVGPSFKEIAARYKGQSNAEAKLLEKLRTGGSGSWGAVPMPPNPDLAAEDARRLVEWILGGV